MCMSDSRRGFGSDIGFIDHLYAHSSELQVITTPQFTNYHSTG
jgi:hypothetical protein